jgi:hypothetical protein
MADAAISIPPSLASYAESALARLSYLYPGLQWTFDAEKGEIKASGETAGAEPEKLQREIFFQLYREKIHAETLAIRNRIYEAINT